MQRFGVVGAIICDGDDVLLVENLRRDGRRDWSTPGGVIDPGESPLQALGREVTEETALTVSAWGERVYRVEVTFVGRDALLSVEVFEATSWSGDVHVDDPDHVVVGAKFFPRAELHEPLQQAPRWVSEPLVDWLARAEQPRSGEQGADSPVFRYRAHQRPDGGFVVESVPA